MSEDDHSSQSEEDEGAFDFSGQDGRCYPSLLVSGVSIKPGESKDAICCKMEAHLMKCFAKAKVLFNGSIKATIIGETGESDEQQVSLRVLISQLQGLTDLLQNPPKSFWRFNGQRVKIVPEVFGNVYSVARVSPLVTHCISPDYFKTALRQFNVQIDSKGDDVCQVKGEEQSLRKLEAHLAKLLLQPSQQQTVPS